MLHFFAATLASLVINVHAPADSIPANEAFAEAISRAHTATPGSHVSILLDSGAVYHLSRRHAVERLLYVSNTASEAEVPNPVKHIGILIDSISNLSIIGRGASIITHGEMTPWAILNSRNISISDLSIDAADPSVPEMTVLARSDSSFIARIHPRSAYSIDSLQRLHFHGLDWSFTGGIAQIHDPIAGTTLRCGSPLADARAARQIAPGFVEFIYAATPPSDARPGCVYQLRHAIRNEVAGLIHRSASVSLSDINFRFMGNFGVVAQLSSDISYSRLSCAPAPGSHRSAAGFADFLQLSGCRGLITIDSCRFAGSHDDPINIHGTHLLIDSIISPSEISVRYMHHQTYGFPQFFPSDTVNFVSVDSLTWLAQLPLADARMTSPRSMRLSFDRPLPERLLQVGKIVIENYSYTPSVAIRNCSFTLTPTRGVLVTTPRPVIIEGCTFTRCPMSAILISDDASSWYESGAVRSVTIARNSFIHCVDPVILIWPEVAPGLSAPIDFSNSVFPDTKNAAPTVHSGINIRSNTFIPPLSSTTIRARNSRISLRP